MRRQLDLPKRPFAQTFPKNVGAQLGPSCVWVLLLDTRPPLLVLDLDGLAGAPVGRRFP